MRHMTTASAAALAIGAAAHAQEPMSHYDADGDGHISSAEFAAYASADLGDLDTDRSGGISADEYASADFARYDQNQD